MVAVDGVSCARSECITPESVASSSRIPWPVRAEIGTFGDDPRGPSRSPHSSIFSPLRSTLFKAITNFLPSLTATTDPISSSWDCRSLAVSRTTRTISASSASLVDLRTPSCSMKSEVVRSPAVSATRKRMPSISRFSTITSRVVPGMSVTMALLSRNSAFRRLDFPAFVGPTSATRTPSRTNLPTA